MDISDTSPTAKKSGGTNQAVTQSFEVQRIYSKGAIVTHEEAESLPKLSIIQRHPSVAQGSVCYGGGFTKNLGNYESCRVYIEVTLPTVAEEAESALLAAQNIVDEELTKQHGKLSGA